MEERGALHLQDILPSNNRLEEGEISEYAERHSTISRANSTPSHDEELPSYGQVHSTGNIIARGHSTLLHRSAWVTIVTILYIAMAIYAWVMTVILSFRPINGKSWGYEIKNAIYDDDESMANFARSAKIYRSVYIVQSIVEVATLPLITAVCASAAVVFTQNQNDRDFRLRQVTALADRRWDDPSLYLSLVRGRWKQHGSALLFGAIIVYIFGAITYPIQSLFLTTEIIKIPTEPSNRAAISDFNTKDSKYISTLNSQAGLDVLQARSALSQADRSTYYPNIWSNDSGVQFLTLHGLSSDNFYSQLPSGFNTGLLRQFAPRVNSTATYETIAAEQFPANCSTESGALYLDYQSSYDFDDADTSYYGLIACMPASSTKSRWQMTRDRQDFTEVLYLNLTGSDIAAFSSAEYSYITQYLYKITVNTTSGYFELPNYMNDNIAGPLLETDPENFCDEKCMVQSSKYSWQTSTYDRPLLMTTLATFGPGSFIDTFPAAYAAIEAESKATGAINRNFSGVCIANPPLSNLILDTSEGRLDDECISFSIWTEDAWNPAGSLISTWLQWFTNGANRFPSVFTAAAYLCNAQLLNVLPGSWDVYQDLGKDMEIPSISMGGIVLVSILMGFYLIPLLFLSLYAGFSVRWTSRLDSFVMLRIGAAAGDKVFPMLVGRKTDYVTQLDEVSGVVRDVSVAGAEDEVVPIGKLGFGEGKRLKKGRRYKCFEGDDEALNSQEFQQVQRRVQHG
ncbi:uncharacterized protein N7477_001653 [Penicillium maclennaniae]|uniref:uncharacterized protein n=1 Tax=Penicillium maclennaniae TaxID=1343394 RepID=UPI00254144FC|nr:uncharacterized protein N7477_001653 [Penicillium maclennaniae]KAJ5681713.1 hypothetical protein N7477_001653 [Penicillium maclennaniae]